MFKQETRSALLWSGIELLMRQGLTFGVSIVLARLLSPEDFGTVGLLALFIAIATAFTDGGFSAALIQRRDITQADETTVFWINLTMGLLMACALVAVAPAIATFYDIPVLVPLIRLTALNVVLSAFSAIHSTLLTKYLDFRTLMKVGTASSALGGSVAILLAWQGFGIWALAVQTLITSTANAVLLWRASDWRPIGPISLESARRLFSFGGYLFASFLLHVIYDRGYTVIIGKTYGITDLAYYSRADGTKQLPVTLLGGILSRITFPIFAAAAGNRAQLKQGVAFTLRSTMLICVPVMLGLAAVADALVLTLFGEPWRATVPILQVLCVVGLFWPLDVINLETLKAQGHSSKFFRLEVCKKLIGVACLLVGACFGVMGVAVGTAFSAFIAFFINAYYTGRLLDYGPSRQLRDLIPILCISLIMAAGVLWIGLHWHAAAPVVLLGQIIAGAISFSTLCALFRPRAVLDLKRLRQRANVSATVTGL